MKKLIFPIVFSTVLLSILVLFLPAAHAAKSNKTPGQKSRPTANTLAKSPYIGAIVVDAVTGKVLFEENADTLAYPASITKLMDLMILLEAIQANRLTLKDLVTITAESSRIGGSQVYLKEHETFTVDELLYALIVQSANDAAVALAIHYAGSKEAFVELMNKRAAELDMKKTHFQSVHGLPPGKDQSPDVSTARDIATLCRALLKYPDAIRYTATKEHTFRPDAKEPFIMRSHNHLLGNMIGCDGLKTGYFTAAGFSIAATAAKNNQRAISVVMGSLDRKTRDAKARDILSKGLMTLVASAPPVPPPVPVNDKTNLTPEEAAKVKETTQAETEKPKMVEIKMSTLTIVGVVAVGMIIALALLLVTTRKRHTR